MFRIHNTFFVHSVVPIYYASIVEVATVACFLDVQQIGFFPRRIICPEVDFLSFEYPPKSEYVKAINSPVSVYLIL